METTGPDDGQANRKSRRGVRRVGVLIVTLIVIALVAGSCGTHRVLEPVNLAVCRDGRWEGVGYKFPGKLRADITVETNRITGITVRSQPSIQKYTDILKPMIEQMIQKQTIEVDDLTGATMSSRALRRAVHDALTQAASTNQPAVK